MNDQPIVRSIRDPQLIDKCRPPLGEKEFASYLYKREVIRGREFIIINRLASPVIPSLMNGIDFALIAVNSGYSLRVFRYLSQHSCCELFD